MTDPGSPPPTRPTPSYGQPYPPATPYGEPYGAPPAYGIAQPYAAPGPAARQHQGALWSMILGIAGLVGLVLTPFIGVSVVLGLCSPFALGLGMWSGKQIDADPGSFNNRGMATAGWITGLIGVIIGVILLVLAILALVFFAWMFSELSGSGA